MSSSVPSNNLVSPCHINNESNINNYDNAFFLNQLGIITKTTMMIPDDISKITSLSVKQTPDPKSTNVKNTRSSRNVVYILLKIISS
jgi:hypothetical protein